MSVYLHDIPLVEAQAVFKAALSDARINGLLGEELLPLEEQLIGRVVSKPIFAKISSPHYHASAMDGFAVAAESTIGAYSTIPKILRINSFAEYVDTGDVLPSWANAVIKIEDVESITEDQDIAQDPRAAYSIRIRGAIPPWHNVRAMGEDMVATQLVLPEGHILRPVDLGAIGGSGHHQVWVAKKPLVGILPTGTELKRIGESVGPGEIIEYNSIVLAGQVLEWGGIPKRYPICPDVLEKILSTVLSAAEENDLVLINAGSSAGSEDFSARVIKKMGRLLVHGIAVRPGHPVIIGMIDVPGKENAVPIIGVPGYPVSAALTGEIFVEPLLSLWLGREKSTPVEIRGFLTRKTASSAGDDDYVRVAVGKVGERTLVTPIARGAGVISSMVRADGIVVFPKGSQGLSAGEEVSVGLYRKESEIANTILASGSHDMILDLMSQYLAPMGRRISSANIGSLGGLIALKRGEAHIAGAHLLDPATGEYNIAYIHQYLKGVSVRVIALAGREQGLIVPKGNPKGIFSLSDLKRNDVQYVNRQRGAGTRLLLDYHLEELGLKQTEISGYDQEEFTHLGVAAAIQSGRADCGLGITAAAIALDLEIVPLYSERYDLIVPEDYFETELLKPLFTLINDKNFKIKIELLPGYDTSIMGKEIAIIRGDVNE